MNIIYSCKMTLIHLDTLSGFSFRLKIRGKIVQFNLIFWTLISLILYLISEWNLQFIHKKSQKKEMEKKVMILLKREVLDGLREGKEFHIFKTLLKKISRKRVELFILWRSVTLSAMIMILYFLLIVTLILTLIYRVKF